MTIQVLAEKSQVSSNMISRIERGLTIPSVEILMRLAGVLTKALTSSLRMSQVLMRLCTNVLESGTRQCTTMNTTCIRSLSLQVCGIPSSCHFTALFQKVARAANRTCIIPVTNLFICSKVGSESKLLTKFILWNQETVCALNRTCHTAGKISVTVMRKLSGHCLHSQSYN